MVELLIPTQGSIKDIPLLMDALDIDIPALLGLGVLYGNSPFVDNVTGPL